MKVMQNANNISLMFVAQKKRHKKPASWWEWMTAELIWSLENQMEMNQMFSHAPYSKRYDWVTHAGPLTLCKEVRFSLQMSYSLTPYWILDKSIDVAE